MYIAFNVRLFPMDSSELIQLKVFHVHVFPLLQLLAVVYDTFSGLEKKKLRKLFFHKRQGCQLAFRLLVTKKVKVLPLGSACEIHRQRI